MVANILVALKTTFPMALESLNTPTEIFIKANSSKESGMVMENLPLNTAKSIQEAEIMTKNKDMAYIKTPTAMYIKANFPKTNMKGKALSDTLTMKVMKGIFYRICIMGKGSLLGRHIRI